MSVIFTIYALLYYYRLLKDPEFVEIKSHPEFWWVTGALFYYFGSTVTNLFKPYLPKNFSSFYFLNHFRYSMYVVLSLFLYSIWSYSFICRAKQRKLSS
ncbi:hypothetical protein ACJVDH_00960 [Pedobacter sp. AW1-32]|uniref:hypothetical protein n=1 Tax=Pedobacter sp. AW1-32 TaxID=3383026 RepID=UPI003FF0C4C3